MLILNKKVAQEIVDKTIDIIKVNVNIMDNRGIIIASGDKNRIGTLHEGALITISRDEKVIIDKALTDKLTGTAEGVNLPVRFRGEIIGVVGISGEWEKVKEYSELVKMSTELYIEQKFLIKEQFKHSQTREQFLNSILNNSKNVFNLELAKMYKEKLRLDSYHKVCVLKFNENDFVLLNIKINYIKKYLEENLDINFFVLDDEFKIVFCISHCDKNKLVIESRKILQKIKSKLQGENYKNFTIFEGCIFNKKIGVHKSFITTKNLMDIKINKKTTHLKVSDYISEIIVNCVNSDIEKEILTSIWTDLVVKDKKDEYINTLNSYYENNCEVALTSDVLGIHRNTLNYRLERIFEITNLHPKNKRDLYTLNLCQSIYLNKK